MSTQVLQESRINGVARLPTSIGPGGNNTDDAMIYERNAVPGTMRISLPLNGDENGFDTCGGSEHQLGIFVSYVEPKSLAYQQNLRVGDQILNVNGCSLLNTTLEHAMALLMIYRSEKLDLIIRRREEPEVADIEQRIVWQSVSTQQQLEEPERWDIAASTFVIKIKASTSGSNFSIKGGYDCGTGIYVSRVDKSSSAWKAGLRPGMRIVSVNNQNLRRITHMTANDLIRRSLLESKYMELVVQELGRLPLWTKLQVRTRTRKVAQNEEVIGSPGTQGMVTEASVHEAPSGSTDPTFSSEVHNESKRNSNNELSNDTNGLDARNPPHLQVAGVSRGSLIPFMTNELNVRGTLLRRESPAFAAATITAESLQQLAETNPQAAIALAQAISETSAKPLLSPAIERRPGSVSFAQKETEMISLERKNSRSHASSVTVVETAGQHSSLAHQSVALPSSNAGSITSTIKRKGFSSRVGTSLDIGAHADFNPLLRQKLETLAKAARSLDDPPAAASSVNMAAGAVGSSNTTSRSSTSTTRTVKEEAENRRPVSAVHLSALKGHPSFLATVREPEEYTSSETEDISTQTEDDDDDDEEEEDEQSTIKKQPQKLRRILSYNRVEEPKDIRRASSPATGLIERASGALARRKKLFSTKKNADHVRFSLFSSHDRKSAKKAAAESSHRTDDSTLPKSKRGAVNEADADSTSAAATAIDRPDQAESHAKDTDATIPTDDASDKIQQTHI